MMVGIWGGGDWDGDEGNNGVERGRGTTTTAMMGRSVYAKLRAKCALKRRLIIVSITRRWMLEQLREAFTLTGDAASRSWSTYFTVILSLGEMFHPQRKSKYPEDFTPS